MAEENQILRSVLPLLAQDPSVLVPPGDDCAVLQIAPGAPQLLAAVDQVVSDVHYYGDRTPPEAAAAKLLKRNLSDIAAMGGTPRWALLALAVARGRDLAWYQAFFQGLSDCAKTYGVSIVGGDTGSLAPGSRGEVGSLTILGTVNGPAARRDAARPGELLAVTGRLGNTLASGHHLDFTPRLAEGRWLVEGGWTRAMMDLSDGLALDLQRMGEASGVGFILDSGALPLAPGATAAGALSDGEDYELAFTVVPERREELLQAWPFSVPLTVIGTVAAAAAVPGAARWCDRCGNLNPEEVKGYEHH